MAERGMPQKKEVEEKEQQLRQSIAQNYSHIKAVENQLAELQLQLNLTSGPKKSALEMLRKKIEAKNEIVAAARQKFAAAAKVAEEAKQELKAHEQSKEELCKELNLLVHQSATAELNKLEQLTKQLESLSRGRLSKSDGPGPMMERALATQFAITKLPSAEDAADVTAQHQAGASISASLPAGPTQTRPSAAVAALYTLAQESADKSSRQASRSRLRSGQQAWHTDSNASKDRIGQNCKQAQQDALPQAASDSAGRFKGFE